MSGQDGQNQGEDIGSDDDAAEGEEPGRPQAARKQRDPRKYVSSWSEKDSLDGVQAGAWVLILRTSGCGWARCSMCGYHGESVTASGDDLMHQFSSALERRNDEPTAKLYTSGSFFDEREVPAAARGAILGELGRTFKRVVVETRPDFVTEAVLKEAKGLCPGLEVAMGLESVSERVLSHSVRKGFTFKDFAHSARVARENGARVRAYILLKPPFLNELEAFDDAVKSMVEAAPLCETLSLNPVNIQRGTTVEKLWKRRIFRPPWLWTAALAVLEAKRKIMKAHPDVRIVCAPSGAGQERGAHNCGLCDAALIGALEEFSIGQDDPVLERALDAGCECSGVWRDALRVGAFPFLPYDGLLRGR